MQRLDLRQALGYNVRSVQQYVVHDGPRERRAAMGSLDSTRRKVTEARLMPMPRLEQIVSKVSIEDITGTPVNFTRNPVPRCLDPGERNK